LDEVYFNSLQFNLALCSLQDAP